MGRADEAEEFAAYLRGLKERSGRSYGQLARRAHLSTSTLHRYCNGRAVPVDYGPVERLARLCGASREELVQLHRRWVRADAMRGATPGPAGPPGPPQSAGPPQPTEPTEPAEPPGASATAPLPDPGSTPGSVPAPVPAAADRRQGEGGPVGGVRLRWGQRWWWPAAGVVALSITVAVGAFATQDPPRQEDRAPVAAPSGTGSRAAGPEATRPEASGSPSASPKAAAEPRGAGGRSQGSAPAASSGPSAKRDPQTGRGGGEPVGAPLSWTARSHEWRHGCDHRYLVDRQPSRVPPPPVEQDARGWATALGAVHGGDTVVEATVRAAGREPVVVEGVYVRVVERRAPLARPTYEMSNGCGGALTPAVFSVNLDAARPIARPQDGYDGDDGTRLPATRLPYQVSAGEPLVLRVEARTAECDCDWYLEVQWSGEGRSGMLRIDDGGKPFRTSGTGAGARTYGYDWTTGAWGRGAA